MKYIKKFDSVSDMDTALASSTISVLGMAMNGNTPVVNIKVVEPEPPVDLTTPFFVKDVSGSDNIIYIKRTNNKAPELTIEKSTNGTTWEMMGTTSTTQISATVPANGKLYLRCSATRWGAGTASYYNCFNSASGNFNVGGNINSLLYGSSFNGQTDFPSGVDSRTFNNLFKSNTYIISAQQLLLPATTLAQDCYSNMFKGCTSLTTAPALPATTLAAECYGQMFMGCTGLTTAPALPATTLAASCYSGMFNGCTSLTTAPALSATTLVDYCYYGMFQECTNLNHIECLATNISASNCTTDWVSNVAATGTFVKNPNMSSWPTGSSGIPSGWTVEEATE